MIDDNTFRRYQEAFVLFGQGKQYIEVRLLNTHLGVVSGIFSADLAGVRALCQQLTALNLESYTVYQVLGRLNGSYVAGKQLNVLVPHARITAKDADIETMISIVTDFDPNRLAKTSASEPEKQAAYKRLLLYLADMKAAGMIPSIITDSGNGYNAYFCVNLPNTPENVRLVQDFNHICCLGYSDDIVNFDPTVTNPSRLVKLPGTWAVKGANTPDRPHRQSCILGYAPPDTMVNRATLVSFVEAHRPLLELPRNAAASCTRGSRCGSGRRQTVYLPDVEGYLDSQGWQYRVKQGDKGTLYILPVCPFNSAHDNAAAFLMRFPNGKAMFRCHHNGCVGNDIHKLLAKYPVKKHRNNGGK